MKNVKILIGNNIFSALLTENYKEQEKGLMYVKPPVPIMIFSYQHPQYNCFWMKNTPSPLDIIFCNSNKILDIKQGEPFSHKLIKTSKNSNLIVEANLGFCESNNIKINDQIFIIHDK